MKALAAVAWICFVSILSGCVPPQPPPAPRSQLDIRQMQTREYQTRDTKMVMKALLNVLQDDGFIVKNAVPDLGLLTATKELPVEHLGPGPEDPLGSIFMGSGGPHRRSGIGWGVGPGWGTGSERREPASQHAIIEASANVTENGSSTRVRVNFEHKTVDNRGGALDVHQIDDPKYYQEFFSKVDKGIFLQREKL